MLKKYTKKDGSKAYMYVAYLGVDPLTGKQKRTTRRGFKTKREARIAEAQLLAEIKENGFIESPKQMTFEQVFNLWIPIYETTVKESTFQMQKDVIRLHILPKFGQARVDKITTQYCQTIVNEWFGYYSKYSNLIGLTQRILEFAVNNLNLIKDNPMKKVIRPKKKNELREDKYKAPTYSAKQLNDFLEKVKELDPGQMYVVFRIIAYTGMREGEVCGLKWTDFDEVNGTLAVRRTVARGKDYKKILQNTKSVAGQRTIPLDQETIEVLKNWKKTQRIEMFKLGFNTNHKDQFIITNEFNEFQYSQYPYALLKKIRKKCEIDPITVHGLRHTHCTLLIESGASLKEVQDRMGHEDESMVLKVYLHINEEKKTEVGTNFANHIAQNQ